MIAFAWQNVPENTRSRKYSRVDKVHTHTHTHTLSVLSSQNHLMKYKMLFLPLSIGMKTM